MELVFIWVAAIGVVSGALGGLGASAWHQERLQRERLRSLERMEDLAQMLQSILARLEKAAMKLPAPEP